MPFNCQKRKTNNLFFSYDSLTIYDGGSSTSSMMGKYCGYSIPPSHVSSSNEVLIHFYSNGYITEAGFKIEFHPIGNKTHQFKATQNIIETDASFHLPTLKLIQNHTLLFPIPCYLNSTWIPN